MGSEAGGTVEVKIEYRGPLVVAVNPDGSETVIGTRERIVRLALGEFGPQEGSGA